METRRRNETKRLKKKIYIYSKNSSRFISGRNDPSSIRYNVSRRTEESNGEEGQTTLSLDPTSKKTVSSSRLITVLASKQPALLVISKAAQGPGGVAIAKACIGGREQSAEREG